MKRTDGFVSTRPGGASRPRARRIFADTRIPTRRPWTIQRSSVQFAAWRATRFLRALPGGEHERRRVQYESPQISQEGRDNRPAVDRDRGAQRRVGGARSEERRVGKGGRCGGGGGKGEMKGE